jgi:hypothetical protein
MGLAVRRTELSGFGFRVRAVKQESVEWKREEQRVEGGWRLVELSMPLGGWFEGRLSHGKRGRGRLFSKTLYTHYDIKLFNVSLPFPDAGAVSKFPGQFLLR